MATSPGRSTRCEKVSKRWNNLKIRQFSPQAPDLAALSDPTAAHREARQQTSALSSMI